MASNRNADEHHDDVTQDHPERVDPVTDQVTDDEKAREKSSSTAEQVQYERRREQRKIDDFNEDRDPLRPD
jgi:hypothetical protein